jgi:serine/threonine-protein phosphatase 2A catalytic subunit
MADKVIDRVIDAIEKDVLPAVSDIEVLTQLGKDLFRTLPNVIQVQAPVTIVGDIHGQFRDLKELLEIGGRVPFTNYLFMGDYVDRGTQSIEVVSYLFALKLKYRANVTLLRGNHESAGISQHFGFLAECIKRYGDDGVWQLYTEAFQTLPLAAVVNGKIACVHGGLSPELKTLADVDGVDRFRETPHSGPMCDLMWSDPAAHTGFQPSAREAGYSFGPDATRSWNRGNGLELTVRAHQLVMTGLEYAHNGQLVTVFSAPDYCMRCSNLAGILELDEALKRREIRFETPRNHDTIQGEVPAFYDYVLPSPAMPLPS